MFNITKYNEINELLKKTTFTQPALYVNSCIISSNLNEIDIFPKVVAGHSIGELSALLAAIFWSIAVIIFKSASNVVSPFLITALKNTIASFCFLVFFLTLSFGSGETTLASPGLKKPLPHPIKNMSVEKMKNLGIFFI